MCSPLLISVATLPCKIKCLLYCYITTDKEMMMWMQASSSEVMVLRASRRYDPETDTVVFGDGSPFSQSSMALGHCGLEEFVDAMFKFSRSMASLGVDNAEYALLVSLCIFSGKFCYMYDICARCRLRCVRCYKWVKWLSSSSSFNSSHTVTHIDRDNVQCKLCEPSK